MGFWGSYVPVAERRAKARKQMHKLSKKGKHIQPVEIEGRTIARSFWGKGWCKHLESFSDYENRLPRGRTYVRNGSVCHLEIGPGRIEAIVSGSSLYNVTIRIRELKAARWDAIKKQCSGQIGSMLELLQGKLSDQVMTVVTDRKTGLFPQPGEIEFDCSCPDWAVMCKHVAAVLYGVGSRLDSQPELLFVLRGVDAQELIAADIAVPGAVADRSGDSLADDRLGDIFGIDLDMGTDPAPEPAVPAAPSKKRSRSGKKDSTANSNIESENDGGGKSALKAGRSKKVRQTPRPQSAARSAPARSSGTSLPTAPTGKSIARLRRKLGLSAEKFGRLIGVTAASVYRWEAASGPLKLQARPLAKLEKLQRETGKK